MVSKQKAADELLKNSELIAGLNIMKGKTQRFIEEGRKSLDSSQQSSDEAEEAGPQDEEKKRQKEIFQVMLNPEQLELDNSKKQKKERDDVAQEETFDWLVKAYRSEMKYVTGWGQSQDGSVALE